jgi:hypothetical protein
VDQIDRLGDFAGGDIVVEIQAHKARSAERTNSLSAFRRQSNVGNGRVARSTRSPVVCRSVRGVALPALDQTGR